MKKLIIAAVSIIFFNACNPDLEVLIPNRGKNSILEDTNSLSAETKQKMEGIYRVSSGSDQFGSQVVLKWSGDHLSLFSEKNAAVLHPPGRFAGIRIVL